VFAVAGHILVGAIVAGDGSLSADAGDWQSTANKT
jgi:hypothetical protein